MFVKVTKGGNRKFAYVSLVEGYRAEDGKVRHRVVKNLGRLDELEAKDPDYLENLKAKFKQGRDIKRQATSELRAKEAEKISKIADQVSGPDEEDAPLLHFGHYALKRIWEKTLGLNRKLNYQQSIGNYKSEFNFNNIASFLIFKKAMKPGSVLSTFYDQDDYLGAPLQGNTLASCYKALDFLKENKDEIFGWVNHQLDKQYGRERATLVFYDVTNAYFESPLTDAEMGNYDRDFLEKLQHEAEKALLEGKLSAECFDADGMVLPDCVPDDFKEDVSDELNPVYLRMRGPSKEHRTDLPLVSVALVIDKYGFPMDFEVFSGNSSEFTTMESAIKKFKSKYKIGKTVVVADRGLNSADNLRMLKEQKLGFLVAQKVSGFSGSTREMMLDLSGYEPIDPDDPDKGKYRLIKDWQRPGKGGPVKCTLVLTWNRKRQLRDEKLLDICVDFVRSRIGKELKKKRPAWANIATTDSKEQKQIIAGINDKELARRKALCGFAAIVYDEYTEEKKESDTRSSDVKEPEDIGRQILLSGREIASQYHRLNQIEECFRIMKSNIGLRPMYVWTSNHVYGHITACVLALLLLRILQNNLKKQRTPMSIGTLCRELYECTVGAQIIDDQQVMFSRYSYRIKMRKGRELMKEEEIGALYVKGLIRKHKPEIMRACGLTYPPRHCSLHELARCLGTRFSSKDSAIPLLGQLGQNTGKTVCTTEK